MSSKDDLSHAKSRAASRREINWKAKRRTRDVMIHPYGVVHHYALDMIRINPTVLLYTVHQKHVRPFTSLTVVKFQCGRYSSNLLISTHLLLSQRRSKYQHDHRLDPATREHSELLLG